MSAWHLAAALPPPAVGEAARAHPPSHITAAGSRAQTPAAGPSVPVSPSRARRSRAGAAGCRGMLTAGSPPRSPTGAEPPGAAVTRRASQKPGTVLGTGRTLPRGVSGALRGGVSEMGARGGSRVAKVTDPKGSDTHRPARATRNTHGIKQPGAMRRASDSSRRLCRKSHRLVKERQNSIFSSKNKYCPVLLTRGGADPPVPWRYAPRCRSALHRQTGAGASQPTRKRRRPFPATLNLLGPVKPPLCGKLSQAGMQVERQEV